MYPQFDKYPERWYTNLNSREETGMLEVITHNEKETEAFGRELAGMITAPAVLCMYGELGAGKTALVRGLAEGLGLDCTVSSPTFTIVNEYLGERDLIISEETRFLQWSGVKMLRMPLMVPRFVSALKNCQKQIAGSYWKETVYADTFV